MSRQRGRGADRRGEAPRKREQELRIRLSQTVSPFGVGAIYDVLGESFVAVDTFRWMNRGERVKLDRLARSLGVSNFRMAPAQPDGPYVAASAPGLPFHRFPEWMFCATCRRMVRYPLASSGETPRCRACNLRPRLVPMRFVQVCRNGHLSDVDWRWWAHAGGDRSLSRCEDSNLRFETRPEAGGGLGSLVVRCVSCHAIRSLDGIANRDAMKRFGIRCDGRQPWQQKRGECDAVPQAVQRGASNLHFAQIASALDIPPDSDRRVEPDLGMRIANDPFFTKVLGGLVDGQPNVAASLAAEFLAEGVDCSVEDVLTVARRERAERDGVSTQELSLDPDEDIDAGEWAAFGIRRDQWGDGADFIVQPVDLVPPGGGPHPAVAAAVSAALGGVVVAPRLREVRAMVGFSRLHPPGTDPTDSSRTIARLDPSLGRVKDWLPCVQTFGEGIFVSLNEDRVASWERRPEVQATERELAHLVSESSYSWLPRPSARFLLVHTLAHLLIRRLTFDCGYASASLRERIYARSPEEGTAMAGLLIYTAAGDAEGSLGGLVRQGTPPRFVQTLLSAVQEAAWCSADPICTESRTGMGSFNRGACHACCLVAETSCTAMNLLLDRTLVVGPNGYLSGVLDASLEAAAGAEAVP